MIYKIYSPRNRTSDFPTWWQWSKFITIHTVKVSAKMEDTERFIRLTECGGKDQSFSRRNHRGPYWCSHALVRLTGPVMALLTPASHWVQALGCKWQHHPADQNQTVRAHDHDREWPAWEPHFSEGRGPKLWASESCWKTMNSQVKLHAQGQKGFFTEKLPDSTSWLKLKGIH